MDAPLTSLQRDSVTMATTAGFGSFPQKPQLAEGWLNQGTFAGKFWELLILGAKILEAAPNLNHQEEADP